MLGGSACVRFGSLRNAYKLIGHTNPSQFFNVDTRIRTDSIREDLIVQIAKAFPKDVSIIRRGGRWRSRLRLSSGLTVCVIVARSVRLVKQKLRWQVNPVRRERKFITLLALLDATNSSIFDMHVAPNIDHERKFEISMNQSWLNRGKRLSDLSQFCEVVARVQRARRSKSPRLASMTGKARVSQSTSAISPQRSSVRRRPKKMETSSKISI